MSERYDDVGPQESGVGVSKEQLERKPKTKTTKTDRDKDYRAEMEAGGLKSAKAAIAERTAPSTSSPTLNAQRYRQQIDKAKQALEQAESLSKSYASKIRWGDKIYDLGTTSGLKDYRQALRTRRSEINEAENNLKRYQSAAFTREKLLEANAVIDAANEVIAKSNEIIEESNKVRGEIYDARVRLYNAVNFKSSRTQNFIDDLGEEFNTAILQLYDRVNAKVKDSEKATKVVEALTPVYTEVFNATKYVGNLFEEINRLKRDAEGRAEWGKLKKGENLTTEQAVARLEHLTLASGDAFIKTIPAAVVASTGYIGAGLVAASSVAYFVSPRNRYYTAVFIGQHPEEFYASIAGSLAAGYSVAKVRAVYNNYRAQIKNTALKNKMDKLIDDYAYLEQHKGAEFPSRAIEIPEPEGSVVILNEPMNEEIWIANKFLQGVSDGRNAPEFIQEWLMKSKRIQFMYGPSTKMLTPTDLDDIIIKYPELKDPFIHPAFQDPTIFGKADLVARVPGSNVQVVPLMTVVLNRIAQQGYITDADIKAIIKANTLSADELKKLGVSGWSLSDLKDLTLSDAAILVGNKTIDLNEVKEITKTAQTQIQELAQLEELEQIEEPTPVPISEPIKEPPPEPPKPPKTLTGRTYDSEMKEELQTRLFYGPLEEYQVTFNWGKPEAQEIPVKAHSFPEAVNKAQGRRRITRRPPKPVDVLKL